ncbi:MAG: hypothetical protein KA184_12945 [Candidatus Hydrogenedentes bacterium]|nr:hypothetical protein [Candidatus Hydrogenedentota bacterium]
MWMRNAGRLACVLGICLLMGVGCEPKDKPRMFFMGFTQRPYADGIDAVEDTFDRIAEHSDMAAFQLDEGVPWPEAYADVLYASEYEGYLDLLLDHCAADEVVCLGVSSLNSSRTGPAAYRGATGNMEVPYPWDTYAFSDEPMIQAYTNFCLRLIERFEPRFFNYAVEANGLLFENPNLWDAYVVFLGEVYTRIKAAYPDLMVGLSVTLRHPDAPESATMRAHMDSLLPYLDFLGVVVYPYIFFGGLDPGNPDDLQKGWLLQAKSLAKGKPVAITETAWPAENLEIPAFGVSVSATPERQDAYVRRVLGAASDIEALFILWLNIADTDAVWEVLPPDYQDYAEIWRDTGLYDGMLEARPGITSWDAWLAKERTE